MAEAQSPQVLSNLIGSIYDCVLDPSRWQRTLAEFREAVECSVPILYLFDRSRQKFLMSKMVGIDERTMQDALAEYASDINVVVDAIEAAGRYDEPNCCRSCRMAFFKHPVTFRSG